MQPWKILELEENCTFKTRDSAFCSITSTALPLVLCRICTASSCVLPESSTPFTCKVLYLKFQDQGNWKKSSPNFSNLKITEMIRSPICSLLSREAEPPFRILETNIPGSPGMYSWSLPPTILKPNSKYPKPYKLFLWIENKAF